MSKIDDGGFLTKGYRIEIIEEHPFEKEIHHPGISRRDWLAGLAMQGIVADLSSGGASSVMGMAIEDGIKPEDMMANICYDYADAMIRKSKEI